MIMKPKAQFAWLHCWDDEKTSSQVLVLEGRIHNRDDLLPRLALRPDATDEAVVCAAYQRWGIPGLRKVVGDWSVVIRDARARAIVLASDFAGVRPLFYYHWKPGKIFWSTRLGALIEATGINAIDEEYVGAFLTVGGCPNRTPYAGIYSVPPGCAIHVTTAGADVRSFWSLPTVDLVRYEDERRYDDQLRSLFSEAVTVRLQTKGPVMAELSGGLDSSSVVCMANHLIRHGAVAADRLTTVSYVHRDSLDTPFIREIEAFCGIDGIHVSTHEDPLVSEEGLRVATPEGWTPLYQSVAAAARRLGATVFLTGQNGDLVMGNWLNDSLQVATPLRQFRIGEAWRQALAWSKVLRIPIGSILSQALRAVLPPGSGHGVNYWTGGLPIQKNTESTATSLVRDFADRTGAADPLSVFSHDWMHAAPERRKHFLALTIMRELRTLQPPEPMQDLDYTHPFAHRPLVEFLMSVPAHVLCGPAEPRKAMRRSLADLWPTRLRSRRSKGLFGAAWAEALRPLAVKLLKTPRWHVVERGWVERPCLTARLERLRDGLECNEVQLRQIILLEYWLRNRGENRRAEAVLQSA